MLASIQFTEDEVRGTDATGVDLSINVHPSQHCGADVNNFGSINGGLSSSTGKNTSYATKAGSCPHLPDKQWAHSGGDGSFRCRLLDAIKSEPEQDVEKLLEDVRNECPIKHLIEVKKALVMNK